MVVMLVPLLVALLGLLTYAIATNAKVAELGRIAYAFGLLVTLLHVGSIVLHLGS